MKKLPTPRSIFLLLHMPFLFNLTLLHGQGTEHTYEDGVYHTLQDFLDHRADTTMRIKKLNLEVPTAKAFQDTLVDHVYFLDKQNGLLKKIFAVAHKGEIYFQEKAMKKLMVNGFGHPAVDSYPVLHRIKERGRYYYGEATYQMTDADIAIMTAMFGMVAGSIYAASKGVSAKDKALVPFVFDLEKKCFYVFATKPKLKHFIKTYYPEHPFELDTDKLETEHVRNFFVELNSQE